MPTALSRNECSTLTPNALTDLEGAPGVSQAAATQRVQAPQTNQVESSTQAEQAHVPSKIEAAVAEQLHRLKPGEAMEIELSAEGQEGLALRGEGKVKVSCREDGSYLAELQVGGMVGLGVGAHLDAQVAKAEAQASLGVTLKAGTTLVFESAEQAAGFVDAATADGLIVSGPGAGLEKAAEAFNVLSKDNSLLKYVANLAKVEVALDDELQGKVALDFEGGGHAKAGFDLQGGVKLETTATLDRERHVLTLRAELAGQGKFGAGFGAAVESGGRAARVGEHEIPLSDADFARCARDPKFLASKLVEALKAPTQRFQELEGDVRGPGYGMHYLERTNLDTGEKKVTSSVAEYSTAAGFGVGPVHASASFQVLHESESGSLEEAKGKAEHYVTHDSPQRLEQEMQARSAAGRRD